MDLMQVLAQILNPQGAQPMNRLTQSPRMEEANYLTQPSAAQPMGMPAPQMAAQPAPQQSAPQQPAMAQSAAAPSPAPSGGGIGGFLSNIFGGGQNAGKNQTIQHLMGQGMDEGTAIMFASNKPALQKYLLERSQGTDPMKALQAEKLGLEIADMRNPKPPTTSDITEYNFAVQQGYSGTLPEFMTEMRKAGAPSVDARQMGTVPPGYRAEYDRQGNVISLAPIPGGPAAAEIAAGVAADATKTAEGTKTGNVVVQDIDRALGLIGDSPWTTTGVGGTLLSRIPATDARNVAALLETVKANAGFAALQAMRDSSPTGGALGQVTERELKFLQATIGNLEQAQSAEQLKYNLERVRDAYSDIVNGPGNRPSGDLSTMPPPEGIDPKVWEHVPPEKRKLWQ